MAPSIAALGAVFLYLWSSGGRENTVYLVIALSSLAGAEMVIRLLLRTFAQITRFSLDPSEWADLAVHGPRWRYEMRRNFVEDPEYADALVLSMLPRFACYAELAAALRREEFPDAYRRVIDKRLWGFIQPTVRQLTRDVVPNEVFTNTGRYSSGKTADEIFDELSAISATGDKAALLDRWQYFWCLRNLNLINLVLRRAFGWVTTAGLVIVGAGGTIAALGLLRHQAISSGPLLRALAAGTLLWMLATSVASSILIVRLFQGTGTFAVSTPCRSTRFDPLWSSIIKIGIVSFTVSFVVYGIGSPFLLEPHVLAHFRFTGAFVGYAAGSFVLCVAVFVTHTIGLHDLMLGSRDNALDRVEAELERIPDNERDEHFERFREIRELQVWPLRGSTIAQLAAGILLPITVQALLLYAGLRGK